MRVENDHIWLDIAEENGPRISACGMTGEESMFGAASGIERETPDGRWRAFAGHRFWVAPERFPETYRLDDAPPDLTRHDRFSCTVLRGPDALGFSSAIDVALAPEAPAVTVTHTLQNDGHTKRYAAPWALTVMKPGGFGILPREAPRTHAESLVPTGTLALWAYARFDDPRVTWARDAVFVRCDPGEQQPWKIGTSGERGWCAYVIAGTAFIKSVDVLPGRDYPDRGCALEAFTQGDFFELETLGPLQTIEPGARVTHVERWSLFYFDQNRSAIDQVVERAARA